MRCARIGMRRSSEPRANRLAERLVPGGELLAEWTDKECRELGEAEIGRAHV